MPDPKPKPVTYTPRQDRALAARVEALTAANKRLITDNEFLRQSLALQKQRETEDEDDCHQ